MRKTKKTRNFLNFLFPKQEIKMKAKKAQGMTLWIIVAVVIVAVVGLFFLLREQLGIDITGTSLQEPKEYIDKCVKDSVDNAVEIMLSQGGYVSPANYKTFENKQVGYLCYNVNYYQPCINQEPMYLNKLKSEIKDYIEPKVKDCFYALEQEYESKGYNVELGDINFNVNLNPKRIDVDMDVSMDLSKNEELKSYDKFEVKVISPLYDLGLVAAEIVNQESQFCYFEYLGFSLLYQDYTIKKINIDNQDTIYKIKYDKTGDELYFAVRSCAIPAGI